MQRFRCSRKTVVCGDRLKDTQLVQGQVP